jgi:hypothetical protein
LSDLLTESSGRRGNGLVYAGVYATGFVVVWLGFRFAQRTAVVFAPSGLALEGNGRRAWHVAWDDLRGWRCEVSSSGQLRSVVLDCTDGRPRRIDMGWIGLGPKSYTKLLDELRAQIGTDEGDPVTVKESRALPIVAFGIIAAVLIVALVILLCGGLYKRIIYWGIR